MKKFVVLSYVSASQIATATQTLEQAGFTVDLSGSGDYAVIDFDAKTAIRSAEQAGTRVWSMSEISDALKASPVAEAVATSPAPVEGRKLYVVARYVTDALKADLRAKLEADGWNIHGNESAPYINFKVEEKEITFATVASGDRVFSLSAIEALLPVAEEVAEPEEIEVPEEIEDDFDDADLSFPEDDEPDFDFSDDGADDSAPVAPLVAVVKVPAGYKTISEAKGDGYSVYVATNGELEMDVNRDETSLAVN